MNTTSLTFQNTEILALEVRGKPAWMATQIAQALGYTDPKRIARNIRGSWADDFEEGVEFDLLQGDELRLLKGAVSGMDTTYVSSMTVLYEEGVTAVLQLSRSAEGAAFRRWWRREVMPALRRTGTYSVSAPDRVPADNVVDMEGRPVLVDQVALAREARLMAREERLACAERRRMRELDAAGARNLREALERLRRSGAIDPSVYNAYQVRALEIELGEPLNVLRTRSETPNRIGSGPPFRTPTQLAKEWGISVAAVGRAISHVKIDGVDLRGHPRLSRSVMKNRRHTDGDCIAYEYSPTGVIRIREAAVALGFLNAAS